MGGSQGTQLDAVGAGPIIGILFGLAFPALAALVRWWMSGVEHRGEETGKIATETRTDVAVLQSRVDAHDAEIVELRRVKHDSATKSELQAMEGRCHRRHRGDNE